jgi:SH3-like domain-containing protein
MTSRPTSGACHRPAGRGRWRAAGILAAICFGASSVGHDAALSQQVDAAPTVGRVTGLPIPRYVSLKSSKVNLRAGPSTEYPTAWLYERVGLPLEVVTEVEGWLQVRDSEGTTGWVLRSLLSGRRTALVQPWDAAKRTGATIAIRTSDSSNAKPAVMVEAGVIANILACDGTWCSVSVDTYRGYIEQDRLWGVYKREVIR